MCKFNTKLSPEGLAKREELSREANLAAEQAEKYRLLKNACTHEPIAKQYDGSDQIIVFCGICNKHLGFECEHENKTLCELDEDEICINCNKDYYDHE